jgi:hypothetical protein
MVAIKLLAYLFVNVNLKMYDYGAGKIRQKGGDKCLPQ